jgi:hypothetical protein
VSQAAVGRFLRDCRKPVLNPPEAIACTSRELIPGLLDGIEHVRIPRTVRLLSGEQPVDIVRHSGLTLPVLARPLGSHGGDGLLLCDTDAELEQAVSGKHDYYLSAFHDYRSEDGYYRKYRVVFIDRQPFPYHLAIADQWMLHYVRADMLSQQWKRDEESRFLQDPAAVLGAAAMDALRTIGQRLDLDFCGIDFSMLPDGRLLVFEANATMLVHLEEHHPALMFKNPYVQQILNAFDAMLIDRLASVSEAGRRESSHTMVSCDEGLTMRGTEVRVIA